MESTIVIKVNHGETLRRINGRVNEDGQLDLDLDGLRVKVCGLFKFAAEADFTLTYVDEDGDIVTLVDDEDLRDAMSQSLNPLRIAVKLNERSGRSYTRSSGSSTPMRSPSVQNPVPNLDRSVSEILKSVPEPVREALSKISLDLASKASSSVPGLAELVDCFSKMGQSYTNPLSEIQAGTESSTEIEASRSAMCPSMNKEPEALKDGRGNEGPSYINNQKLVLEGIRAVEASVTPDASCDREDKVEKVGGSDYIPKAGDFGWFDSKSVASNLPASGKKAMKAKEPRKPVGVGASANTAGSLGQATMDSRNSFRVFPSLNLMNECPFTGMPLADDSALPIKRNCSRFPPFSRNYNHGEGLGGIFHRGVRCDGCGVYPITGPRFKSKVKEDYDLCLICFTEMGDESDYIRMDRPVPYRHPYHHHKGLSDPNTWMRPPTAPHVLRCGGMQPHRRKLDSRFILDVNILDGTVMGPSTPFTKIWRIKNNGSMVWPQGTQLVWIGGDKLSEALSVELQISSYGLAVDNELDVAVDFTAPELPGRYTSYWRMSSPYGQKFGQRVWVLIQVDSSLKDSMCDSLSDLNLNLPPNSSTPETEMVNLNAEPMVVEDTLHEPNNSNLAPALLEPMVEAQPNDQEQNFPINDTLLVGGGFSAPLPPEVPTLVSYPVVDSSEVAPVVPSYLPSTSSGLPSSSQGASEITGVEQTLLRELEEMGFKQVDLNKEILRMNEYNLEQSVDELCGVAEWDPILEELREMGFSDNVTNKRLLKKNNGSIKRVVMDLIAGEKA
ncbi:protein JOKA2-like isoform X2 [Rhododendron vialii]|uniref:protein JOKA2-like isoform X2 n=1 Tax=Rhododendron vialii TaxID=182163 RepID=UPI00265FE0AD|nr:protein JOKA2-like isoform X2 [Rhododendron vialii]